MAFSIDLDDIASKRQEELGSADRFPFVFKGQEWSCLDPLELSDEQKYELQQVESKDLDAVIEFYLGDQATDFIEAGGGTSKLNQALEVWIAHNTDESGPTRRAKSLNRSQRRSKQR